MRTRISLLACALILLTQTATTCYPITTISIPKPAAGSIIEDCTVDVKFSLFGMYSTPPTVTLNFQPLTVVEGPPQTYTATLGAEDGMFVGTGTPNLLLVQATTTGGDVITQGSSFHYAPKAEAFTITNPADLPTGPLAHGRVGDTMLRSCQAKFVIQDVEQRDLYSVGQYGGNLIDAERLDNPGVENWLEFAPMVNVETVINADMLEILNDGADGLPAEVRTCGPDDLLDFANPSSQIADVGFTPPANLNDNDQTITGCTTYSLGGADDYVTVETVLTNEGPAVETVVAGDWLNPAGELDVFQSPNAGVGPALTNTLGPMSFTGRGAAAGVDYSYITDPLPDAGEYVVISGVTVVLHNTGVINALLGLDPGDAIAPGGGTFTMRRFIGVGDGTSSNAIDLDVALNGTPSAHVDGCVTVNGVPAPGARVTVATFAAGLPTDIKSHFTTDATGCYAGDVPVEVPAVPYGIVASRPGTPYVGGGTSPAQTTATLNAGDSVTADFDLPQTGALRVTTQDELGAAIPARVTVVGFDPSPRILVNGPSLPGFGGSTLALFDDPNDREPFGVSVARQTGASGQVVFDLEPGAYQVVISRGTEYSIASLPVTITAGNESPVTGQIARVLDTAGFVSSDFHVHGINSADSGVSDVDRVLGYAAEGVDNIVMTDHHVHTDLTSTITTLGLTSFVTSTIGEEITTFDYGHFNAYPMTIDASRISGGSTDWAVAAPVGAEFPSAGAFNATPGEIFSLATTGATSTADTTVQINHIDSHFEPLKIDTSLVPPMDALDAAGRLERRLDEPLSTNLFFAFPALELWNGDGTGDQDQFLNERIGIWFNLLNQGIPTTFIADTDSHRFTNLSMAGARTWTAAPVGADTPSTLSSAAVAQAVDAGKATGGQGLFVTTRLLATDGSGAVADLTAGGSTSVSDDFANVELEVRVQAPTWAPFDTIEIYRNAPTTPVDPAAPYLYGATPDMVLTEGDCNEVTTGDGNFDLSTVSVAPGIGASRLETTVSIPYNGLTEDSWFVAVVKGSGSCESLFPVYPKGLSSASNTTLADLLDGNVGDGTLALGATNALYYQHNPGP
jgi:hypothetical protein